MFLIMVSPARPPTPRGMLHLGPLGAITETAPTLDGTLDDQTFHPKATLVLRLLSDIRFR